MENIWKSTNEEICDTLCGIDEDIIKRCEFFLMDEGNRENASLRYADDDEEPEDADEEAYEEYEENEDTDGEDDGDASDEGEKAEENSKASGLDCVQLFFKSIGAYKLLSAKQEIELAKRVKAGDEEAKEALVNANLRLVADVAQKYKCNGLDYQDLIQEGSLGLMKAVEKFDYRKGCRFSTYATWWIRQAIRRAVTENGYGIRTSTHAIENAYKISSISYQMEQELERTPTTEELAERIGKSVEYVTEHLMLLRTPVSLDEPLGESDNTCLGDFLSDEGRGNPQNLLVQKEFCDRVTALLKRLPRRESRILRMRYGFYDDHAYSLDEIGEYLNITRERVRQIERKALAKLRTLAEARELRGYLCG